MRPLALSLLIAFSTIAASAADLATGFYTASPVSASPGQLVRFGGSIVNDDTAGLVAAPRLRITFSPDIVLEEIRFNHFTGPEHHWNCATSPGLVDCIHADLRPKERQWFELALRMPEARTGGRYPIVAEATTSSPDAKPQNNRAEGVIVVTRVIPVVFYDELKPAIEEANQFCTGEVPCSISITLHPELLREIHLTEALPVVTACNLTIINPRSGFAPPPRVTLRGDGLKSGNGLELRSACNGSFVHVEGINFMGFPENGIAITGDTASRYSIEESAITENGLRGVAVMNPHAITTIEYCRIAGNRASGVAVWQGARTRIHATSIGIREGEIGQRNGASGIFVWSAGGHLEVSQTIIANHPHFGITVMAGATLSLSPEGGLDLPNRLYRNANLDVDWNVDGPTPNDEDESDGVPNAPRILSAQYDAATKITRVTVELHTRTSRLAHYFEVFLYGGYDRTMFGTAQMERIVARKPAATELNDGQPVNVQVTFDLPGEIWGRFLSAQTAVWPYPPSDWPNMPPHNMSELSAAFGVR